MKQIASDFREELEQNLNSAADTVKAEPKKFFQSIKASVTGKQPKQINDFGKVMEKMAANPQSTQGLDPLMSDKPAPSKKMMAKITDMTAAIAARKTEELRKRLARVRNEAINPEENKAGVSAGQGAGPEVKVASKKLTPIQQSVRNAENATESKDVGGMG